MTKIGLDLRFWRSGTGGLGRYSRNLLSELLKIDPANQYTAIITPADEAEFSLQAPNLRSLVVDVPHFSPREQTQLNKILTAQKFDLVHFANFNHPIFYRRPFVVTVHDLIMHLYPSGAQKSSPLRQLAYKAVMNDCRRAAKIIVPSQATRDDLVRMLKFPYHKIVITPEGSEAQFRPIAKNQIEKTRAKLGVPAQYLLFVSRWEKYKGLPALIEAYQRLNGQYPELGLVICGKPDKQNPEVADLVLRAQQTHPKIITPGFISDEDLAALYAGAAAYIHPSWYEGFGIMILEAFAAGAPVITSNNSSLPEVVGQAGLLIDPHNTDELTEAIRKVLSDPKLADELRQKGFQRVKQFSWRAMAEQTLKIYDQVLGR